MGHQVTRARELMQAFHKGTMHLHLETLSSLYSQLLDYAIRVKFRILTIAEPYLDFITSVLTTMEPQTSEGSTNFLWKKTSLAMLQSEKVEFRRGRK